MSQTYFINKLTQIKDPFIKFSGEVNEMYIKGQMYHVLPATLAFTPESCKHCGCAHNSSFHIHGYKVSHIRHTTSCEIPTIIKLKKQRWRCGECDRTFTLETPLVKEHCCISQPLRRAVVFSLGEAVPSSKVAVRFHVSTSTVSRSIQEYQMPQVDYAFLPAVLSFDEFKATKDTTGSMAFMVVDPIGKTIIDIVDDRRKHKLREYFQRFPKHVREQVKFIVIDMYAPYLELIKELFPNAEVCIDKFHVVQLLSRALNKTRITIMNKYPEAYNKLKKYWKLLLLDSDKLKVSDFRYCRCYKAMLSSQNIVDRLLEINPLLKQTYWLYQNLLGAIKRNDSDSFYAILSQSQGVSQYMQTSIRTLTSDKFKDGVINCLTYGYNNGFIEGCNNKIKVLKRVSYGYRKFVNFKARILISFGLAQMKYA